MIIRRASSADWPAIWDIIRPVIRAGETYTLDRNLTESAARAYWLAPDKEVFVADADGDVLGTYYMKANQAGGGAHVCNCGYMTASSATGKGIARRMCAHSLDHARARGFFAMQFNFVVSTNVRAIGLWQSMGFEIVGRLPAAFDHPEQGKVDALVMYQGF